MVFIICARFEDVNLSLFETNNDKTVENNDGEIINSSKDVLQRFSPPYTTTNASNGTLTNNNSSQAYILTSTVVTPYPIIIANINYTINCSLNYSAQFRLKDYNMTTFNMTAFNRTYIHLCIPKPGN